MTDLLLFLTLACALAAALEAHAARRLLRRVRGEEKETAAAPQRSPDKILLEWLYGGDR